MEEFYDSDCPCDTCLARDGCDGWEAQFCCAYCRWMHGDNPDCESCNPMDI